MTYTDYFGFSDFPFQLTPDCRFFYDARPHRKAMAYLYYGLSKSEGFVVITGEVGTGKTLLVEQMLSLVRDREVAIAHIMSSQMSAEDMLRLIAAGFGMEAEGASKISLVRQLESSMHGDHKSHRRRFIIVDEAQGLSFAAIEELRLLSNFISEHRAAVQIFLVGQPELRRTMMDARLESLRQRVVASCHLVGLDANETRAYIEHRLRTVGWHDDPRISDAAHQRLFAASGGIPRRINTLCDRLLLLAFLEEKHLVEGADVDEAFTDIQQDLLGAGPGSPVKRPRPKTEAPPGRQNAVAVMAALTSATRSSRDD